MANDAATLPGALSRGAPWLLALFFFLLYLSALAPGVLPADSGEFQVVAARLGVAHPPGFPLYTMLAHAMTWLPLPAGPAYKVNLLSAITGALTLGLIYLSVWRLTGSRLGGVVAATALGTAATYWAQSTTANVRSLTALFTALAIYLLLLIRERRRPPSTAARAPSSRVEWLFVLVMVLAITHHASLIFMAGVFVLYWLLLDPALLRQPRRWPPLLLAGLAGLLPLLYLVWRGAAGAYNAPPDLASWSGFWHHVLALGFRGDFFAFTEAALLWERLRVIGNVMSFQFSPWLLAGMAAGLLLLLWQDKKLALLLGGSWGLHSLITAIYRAPQTVEYMLPAYVAAALLLGAAVGQWPAAGPKWRTARLLLGGLLLAAALVQGAQRYPSYVWLAGDQGAIDYTNQILRHAPEDSLVLADWHWATPLWYRQEVAGERPDLSVEFVYPTGEPYEITWARRIGQAWAAGQPVVATHFHTDAYAALPPPEPLGEAFLFRQTPRRELPADFAPLEQRLDQAIRLHGYALDPPIVAQGAETTLTLAWQPLAAGEYTLFAHLVGANGRLYSQQDLPARPQADGLTLTQLRLTPPPGALPGDYAILIGAYTSEGRPLLNEAGEARFIVAGLTVVPMSAPPVTLNRIWPARRDEAGRRLFGYDWDNSLPHQPRLYLHWQTDAGYVTETMEPPQPIYELPPPVGLWRILPARRQTVNPGDSYYVPFGQGIVWTGGWTAGESVRAGDRLRLRQTFHAGRPLNRDWVVSVRLVGYEADGFHWAWWDLDDGVPALGGIPTLKWIAGSTVYAPHFVRVDETAPAGQTVSGLLRLYDAFTRRPLPILDQRHGQDGPWLVIGRATVE